MDTIAIENLIVKTRIGVPEEERMNEQPVEVTAKLRMDLRQAARDDSLSASVDYDDIAQLIRNIASEERHTVERFAEDIAYGILRRFRPASVQVTIRKKAIPDAEAARISITRP